ncbi:MAG TPA: TolC family protein [Elusimicrobiota bacterium]|jgi:outer membrane protein|nr:TolC family protein [Elusimicrobiota bacterium]
MITLALAGLLLAPPAAAAAVPPFDAAASSAAEAAPLPITLDEAYDAALKRSEAVAEKGETYAQVMAELDVLWSDVKPRLNLEATQTWQDTQGPNEAFTIPSNQHVVAINAQQPLFSGLRDFLAVKAGRAQGESAQFAYRRAKQLLYQDVANAYLNLLQSHRDIATHESQVELIAGQVKVLKDFEDIGRSRRSEVLAAEAQEALDAADLETSRGLERVQQATLRFLTGIDRDMAPLEIPVPQAADLEPFLDRAQHRADVEGARKDLEYSDLYVSIQRRQYWPTVSLGGNYYLERTTPFYGHVDWDATLTGQMPIYWGGQIGAQTREAQAQRGFNEQALSLALRTAELDVRSAHDDLISDLAIVGALEKAMTLAEANAKAQAVDYRHGLVTNIDVLTSLTTVQITRLSLDAAEIQAYYARVRLEVAAGGPASAL